MALAALALSSLKQQFVGAWGTFQADPAAAGSHEVGIAHTPCDIVNSQYSCGLIPLHPLPAYPGGHTPEINFIGQSSHCVWRDYTSCEFDLVLNVIELFGNILLLTLPVQVSRFRFCSVVHG